MGRREREESTVLTLRPRARAATLAASGASRTAVALGRIREWIGGALSRLGVPGAVADAEIDDPVSGQHVEIRVRPLFTRISIDGRDYYFNRLTGRFDGTGSGCQ